MKIEEAKMPGKIRRSIYADLMERAKSLPDGMTLKLTGLTEMEINTYRNAAYRFGVRVTVRATPQGKDLFLFKGD